MSEPQGAPAPQLTPAPAIPGAQTAPQPQTAADPDAEPAVAPKWLSARLERAEKQALSRLGFKDESDAKSALEQRRAAEEAAKSTEEKRLDAEKRAKKLEGDLGERDEVIARLAETRMSALPDSLRSAIEETAGEDPLLQLQLIERFEPAWKASGQSATPKPAQTAAPAAPAPAPGQPKTDFQKWNDLKPTDPVGAALFYRMNSMRIEQSKGT
jgi:hypothetical protein